jgi:hypothetical protein
VPVCPARRHDLKADVRKCTGKHLAGWQPTASPGLPQAAPERIVVLPLRPTERIRQVTMPGIAKTEIASGEFGPAHNQPVLLYSALTGRPVIGTVHSIIPLRVLD